MWLVWVGLAVWPAAFLAAILRKTELAEGENSIINGLVNSKE